MTQIINPTSGTFHKRCEIEKAVKLLSQQLIWMYDDGKISYELCLDLSSKLIDIAEMVRGEEIDERKKGKWIPFEYGDDTWHKCTACGVADKYIDIVQRPNGKTGRLKSVRNFCPNCGADMREGDAE